MTGPGSHLPVQRSGWRWLPLTLAVLVADLGSKQWIERTFTLYEARPLLPVLDITRLHNPGAAFSFLADAGGWQRWLFTTLAVVVSAAIVLWLRRLDATRERLLAVGLAAIAGGAVGNLIDRVRLGYVVDFVHVHWNAAYFPAFNVADSAISVGAGLILLDSLREWLRHRRAPR